jgi:hypothetical protein
LGRGCTERARIYDWYELEEEALAMRVCGKVLLWVRGRGKRGVARVERAVATTMRAMVRVARSVARTERDMARASSTRGEGMTTIF